MKITPILVKDKLKAAISAISEIAWMYSRNPESDFTRERKLPMNSMLHMLLKFSGNLLLRKPRQGLYSVRLIFRKQNRSAVI